MNKKIKNRPNPQAVGTDTGAAQAVPIMNHTENPKLRLENITYIYGKNSPFEVRALDGISLDIQQNTAGFSTGQTVEQLDQGGFTRSRMTDDARQLPCVDIQRNPIQSANLKGRVLAVDVGDILQAKLGIFGLIHDGGGGHRPRIRPDRLGVRAVLFISFLHTIYVPHLCEG